MGRTWQCVPADSTAVYFSIDHFANASGISNLSLSSIKFLTDNYIDVQMNNFQLYKNSTLIPSQASFQGNTLVVTPNDPILIQSPDTDTISITAKYKWINNSTHTSWGFNFSSSIQSDGLSFTGTVNSQPITVGFQINGQSSPYSAQEKDSLMQSNSTCRYGCFYGKPFPLCCGSSYYSDY